jgi:hypothetical protein
LKKTKDLKKQLEDFHRERIKHQKVLQEYYDDNFRTSIKSPYRIKRTGTAARIVDSACDAVDTSNPQVFCEPRKKTKSEEDKAIKRAILLNHWVKKLGEEINEAKKNGMLRGEAWYQVEYNDNYDPNNEESLPIIITAPDPMIILGDPHEANGVPRTVVKSCSMNVNQIEQMYPEWSNPEKRKITDSKGVEYVARWDSKERHIQADGESILGPQKNYFGFVPFSHCYSGFGKRSPEGKPETVVVGRLSKILGRLVQECEIESRLDSQIGLYTNPVVKLEQTASDSGEPPSEEEFSFEPGKTIVVPYGWKIDIIQGQVPGPQMYQHLYQIRSALGVETPAVSMGMPSTSRATGRQEDIYSEAYSRKYRTFKNNQEKALATALSMGLRIVDTVPDLLPITVRATVIEDGKTISKEEQITKSDIGKCYDCRVEFKSDDELIENKNFIKYERLAGQGRVSWKTLLVKGLNYTEDDADEEINEALAEKAWREDPTLLGIVLSEALEQAGQHSLLRRMQQQGQMQNEMAQATPSQGAPRPSEARNPQAAGIMRQTLNETPVGLRQPPGGVG